MSPRAALPIAVARAQVEINAEKDRIAKAGREVWPMHARKCRRNLELRYKIQPSDLWGQIAHCSCGWPEQRLQEYSSTSSIPLTEPDA